MIARVGRRFAYRLALAHGRLDVDGMLAEMTSSELAGWEAFAAVEPWGSDVEDHRAGVIASTVANMAGKALRRGKVLTPDELFPRRKLRRRRRGPAVLDQVHAVLGSLAAAPRAKGVAGGKRSR